MASRRSGASAAAFWGVALVAGVGAAFLIAAYLDQRTVTVSAPTQKVVVAATDLPLASRLKAEQLKVVEWPVASLPVGTLNDTKEVEGRVVTARVLKGEPVLAGKLAAKNAGNGLTALIPGDMRAMAVRVDDVVGVAGFIHPENRVDVIVTMRPARPADAEPTSKVILQNVKVLAVGKDLEPNEKDRKSATSATVATLLVRPGEAEKLALAATEGRLILTLRGWTDESAVATDGAISSSLLGNLAARAPEPAPADKETRPPEATPATVTGRPRSSPTTSPRAGAPMGDGRASAQGRGNTVEILRGDQFEQRRFDGSN